MTQRWITFDLDETLMKNPFGEWVFPEIRETYKLYSKSEDDILPEIIATHRDLMVNEKFLEAYDWDKIVNDIFVKNNINEKLNIENLVVKHTTKSKVKLLEENLLESLQTIKKKGFKIAAVTNGYYKYQYPVLVELGLDSLLDKIITADKSYAAKPDVQVFSPLKDQCILAHVGDRIDHDVVVANRHNIVPIFITKSLPDHILDLPINKRITNKDMMNLCREKWISENNNPNSFDPNLCYPSIVISSIEELSNNIDLV